MKPASSRKKIIILVALGVICLIGLLTFTQNRSKKVSQTSTSPQPSSVAHATSTPLPDPHPARDVIALVTNYVQARENSVGADQATPNSWLASVKPISTTAWFAELQPGQKGSAGSATAEFNLAHNNDYIVSANLSKCIWNFKLGLPTPNAGDIYCELTDSTLSRSTQAVIPDESLPFGWSHNGAQAAVTLKLIKQNGTWLINDDTSGADQD